MHAIDALTLPFRAAQKRAPKAGSERLPLRSWLRALRNPTVLAFVSLAFVIGVSAYAHKLSLYRHHGNGPVQVSDLRLWADQRQATIAVPVRPVARDYQFSGPSALQASIVRLPSLSRAVAFIAVPLVRSAAILTAAVPFRGPPSL